MGTAVERPALDQLEVEVRRALERNGTPDSSLSRAITSTALP
ncbi:hypothetical protein [Kribbella sp. C-35]